MSGGGKPITLDIPDAAFDEFDDLYMTDAQVESILGNEKSRDGTEEENYGLGGTGSTNGVGCRDDASERGELSAPESARRFSDLGSDCLAVVGRAR